MLQNSIEQVLAIDDYRPSAVVNELFSRLVEGVVQAPDQMTFTDETMRNVQRAASAAETELELYWARKIQCAEDPRAVLEQFPYTDNYAELVRREIDLVEKSGMPLVPRARLLIIGSGPLPLSALEYVRQRGLVVDHVDISTRAVVLCRSVSGLLGIQGETLLGDGQTVHLEASYDAILIAGLAGESLADKQSIIDHILPSLRNDGRLIVRSAAGARRLLYPAIEARDLTGVQLLEEYHPDDEVINSVFVYKKELS